MPKKPNDIITLDLKFFDGIPVLWIIDAYTRYAIGKVLKNKEMEEVVKNVENEWFPKIRAPTSRIWLNNGKEFANQAMYTLAKKWDIDIKFKPPYALWNNRLNECSHASADKAVHCYIKDHPKTSLQEAVNHGAWTHNTNTSKAGFIPMQLMFGTLPKFRTVEDDKEDTIPVNKYLQNIEL